MSRPPPSLLRAEVLRHAGEVWWTTSSKAALDAQWEMALKQAAKAQPAFINPGVYDQVVGLGPLARVILLRDIFRSEIYRDAVFHRHAKYRAGSWQFNISRQAYADRLFNVASLGNDASQWIEDDSVPGRLIKSTEWRSSLCTGFGANDDAVRGLDKWFRHRYRQALPGREMTPDLLFHTRFHGPAAVNNYVNFVLTGAYAPGVNTSLLQKLTSPVLPKAAQAQDKAHGASLQRVLDALGESDNQGRPVIAVTCRESKTRLTQIAWTIVEALSRTSANVCYLHVRRMHGPQCPSACTLQALVESLHLYTQGFADLTARSSEVWPETEMKRRIAEVRAFLVRTPTTILFDGYQHAQMPYPAIADFVLDEPLSRLLRMLVHPDLGDSRMPAPVGQFRQCHFVLLCDHVPQWASTHLRRHETFASAPISISDWLQRMELAHPPKPPRQRAADTPAGKRDARHATREIRQLRVDAFSRVAVDPMISSEDDERAAAYMVTQLADVDLRAMQACPAGASAFEHLFALYWRNKVRGWARVLLRSMALSLTGLRYGSVAQLLEAYARYRDEAIRFRKKAKESEGRRDDDGADDPPIEGSTFTAPEQFRRIYSDAFRNFAESAGHSDVGLVEIYASGQDESLSDPTRHPTQTVTSGQDLLLWGASAKPQFTDPSYSYALRSSAVRQLIVGEAYSDRFELAVLARISCELCLQAYRILCMELPPEGRRWRVGLRWLVESIYYGINALAMEWPSGGDKRQDGRPAVGLRFTLGELPSNAASALGFMYFTVFRELLCGGNVTSLGRDFGNGLLELELLRFFGDHEFDADTNKGSVPAEPFQAWTPPPLIRYTLLDADHPGDVVGRIRRGKAAVLAHLLAMCRAARRAHRVELLGETLQAIDQYVGDALRDHPDLQVSVLKFRIDHLLMTRTAEAGGLPRAALREVDWVVRQLCNQDSASSFARFPVRYLLRFYSQTARYIERCRKSSTTVSPKELESKVDLAAADICKALPPATILPDTIALLERLAEFTARMALVTVPRRPQMGLQRTAGAIALFWLLKNLASRRQRATSSGVQVRVGAKTAQWNLELSILLRTVLGEFPKWAERGGHGERFERRVARNARSTLDTFLREQGGDKANHIVCLILESKYARHNSASVDSLIRIDDRSSITQDLRLDPLLRCMGWLRMAELQLLEFTARPTLRVMLVEERIACALEVLYRASFSLVEITDKITGRKSRELRHGKVQARFTDKLYPFAELIANDALQLIAFWDFLKAYSPSATQKAGEWLGLMKSLARQLKEARLTWLWDDTSDSLEWHKSMSLIDDAVRTIDARFPPDPRRSGVPTGAAAAT